MGMTSKGVWFLSVVAAAAVGWFAAMEVSRGPALRSEQDAYERFSNAFTITDTLERDEVMTRLVRRLTPETLPGAIRAYKEDQPDVYNNDFRLLMWYWAKEDPRGMLQEVQTWPEVRAQRMAAGEAVYWILKREGYDAARAVFDTLPNHQRDPALSHLVLAYVESSDAPNLVELIDSYDVRDERDFAAGIVVGRILEAKGPEVLTQWVEGLPDGPGTSNDLKAVAFRAAQSELMRRDHFDALEAWLERVADQPWAKGGGWRTIGVHLAKRDPLRAIAWAESLSPEKGRDEVLGETLRAYASHDRVGALQWMRSRPPARDLDPGAARLAYEFAARNPDAALEMVGRIQDPEIFAQAEKMLTVHWRSLGPKRREALLAKLAALPRPSAGGEAAGPTAAAGGDAS